jgi:hypothetical protein
MKIETVSAKTQKLFELYFIKIGVNKKSSKTPTNRFSSINLTTVMIQFKKVLQIIFKYHKHSKRIRFIGAPQSIENIINSSSPHTAVPFSFHSKQIQSHNFLKKKKSLRVLKLDKKPDLIVFFESKNKDNLLLKESFSAKIPTIVFNHEVLKQFQKPSYSVSGNVKIDSKSSLNNMFFTILKATLKR